jgi:methyl-accepting chemotaxis protein
VYATGAGVPVGEGVVALTFVTVLHLGVLGIVLGGNVATELRRLTDAATAIGAGDLAVAPESRRRDEIGELGAALAGMRDSLADAFEESAAARETAETAREETEAYNDRLLDAASEVATAMEAVADGRFDRRLDTDVDADAVDRIADAYGEMAADLSETIHRIRSFAETVETTATATADDAAAVVYEAAELARAGDEAGAAERLDDAFGSVCSEEHPDANDVGAGRTSRCLRHREAYEDPGPVIEQRYRSD